MKIVTGYTGEKHITSADDQGFNAGIVGNGLYVLPIGSQFALTYSGTTVTIADGEGVLQGVHFRAESESLTISKPSSGYRCTVIYVRYTKTSGVESVGLYTKDGSTATSESAVVVPTVTSGNIRNGATKAEAVLFRVYSSTIGIYKTEMAADVVSSLASLTSGVSALNSNMPVEVTTLTSAYGALTYKCYKIGKLVAVLAQLATDQEVPAATHAIEGLPYMNAVSNFTPITARNYTNGQVMTFSLRRQSNNQGALYVNEAIPSGASIRMNFVYANE